MPLTRKELADYKRMRRQNSATLDLIDAVEKIIDKHKLDGVDVIQMLTTYTTRILNSLKTVTFERRRR